MVNAYLKEIAYFKKPILLLTVFVFGSASLYLFCSEKVMIFLGMEDGIYESLTAVFFLLSSLTFLLCFIRTKNIFLLGLTLLMFLGAGEEVSWGQRLFHFNTPKLLNTVNVQHEFNIHNIEIFNDQSMKKVEKTGLHRLLDINVLFKIFSMGFFVFIPLFFYYNKHKFISQKMIRMPIASSTIGIFFFISWLVFYSLRHLILPQGMHVGYYISTGEIFECSASLIYFITSLYFYKDKKDNYLGKDIKQII